MGLCVSHLQAPVELRDFTFEELQAATGAFSHENCIGKGSFGEVYRGNLLNKQVAIKRFFASDNADAANQLAAEISAISRTNHPNLVKVLGSHVSPANKLLVLEFISNNSLKYHLHDPRSPSINWRNRMKIALGSAKGLEYLHDICQPSIIHRDIKPENILLCDDFQPKIGDFGLARDITQSTSHLSTNPKGTRGYVAPECFTDRRLTKKSDVFAFGMILLELITGKKPVFPQGFEDRNLAEWAVPALQRFFETKQYNNDLVDRELGARFVKREMYRMIVCAAACVYKPERQRPEMSQIVKVLQGRMQPELVWKHETDQDHLYPDAPYLARTVT